MPTIYDNQEQRLLDGLKAALNPDEQATRADFCTGYFNLRGWKNIADAVENLPGAEVLENGAHAYRVCRLLVGMQKPPEEITREIYSASAPPPMDNATANKIKKQLAREFREQLTLGIPTNSDETALRQLCRQLKHGKLAVKLHLEFPLHAKLYLVHRSLQTCPLCGFLGSSNLTLAGLSKQGELNIDVLEQDAAQKLAAWFDEHWDARWSLDITNELAAIIEESWASEASLPPYYIYLKTAWHLSREARSGISEFRLPRVFKNELLDFQEKAVLVAARHLHKRGGVLLGDVVGLGKTITASALAKLFEDDFGWETLIVCPKNLIRMWEDYVHRYQLHAKVISLSRAQNQLPDERRYRLVIVDESHNLRNREGRRYSALKSYVEQNESRVILLSATPYNKTYNDLSAQLRLFISDDADIGIAPERYIEAIGGAVNFAANHPDTPPRSIRAFERSEKTDDWRELMRLYLVRRTRSFIKQHYARTDASDNRKYLTFPDGSRSYFPDRVPKRISYDFSPNDQYARLYSPAVVTAVGDLRLPRYGLQQYLAENPNPPLSPDEQTLAGKLNRAGRRLMGFCRTNLFKRLESGGYAFLLSLQRHIVRNLVFVHALENKLPLPIAKNAPQDLNDILDDADPDSEETLSEAKLRQNVFADEVAYRKQAADIYTLYSSAGHKDKFDWFRGGIFKKTLKQHLLTDAQQLLNILGGLNAAGGWKPAEDKKLGALTRLVSKIHPNEKILVFTQFSDTAEYLAEQLKTRGISSVECVSGADENPTEKAWRFSPESNRRDDLAKYGGELRVLISTDVLSEGQNLQDAHIIVNYDLPWAIIRLIQRAGRVDRIGQKSHEILCYSFFPADGIEAIINLRGTLRRRIRENAQVIGADEQFFDKDDVNLLDLYNEKSGILDDDSDAEVDLASYAWQIWKNAIEQNPGLAKTIPALPNVVYSAKNASAALSSAGGVHVATGVIVYTRTADDNDMLAQLDAVGATITQSQYAILRAAECAPETPAAQRAENHHALVRKAVAAIGEEIKATGGTLGRKTGVKYRVYVRLERFYNTNKETLFHDDTLKRALDDIFKGTLTEHARDVIGSQLKAGVGDEHLAELVKTLREDNKLILSSDAPDAASGPQLICSLGIV
ncbi:MAG: phospholipase D-like domain-containing protein [Opitutaceae bacterium]|jgi:superfamily II DNA or RNA helicase|nr:phospholipase D-like domain-containing protein [Opitutaceae bacterium]